MFTLWLSVAVIACIPGSLAEPSCTSVELDYTNYGQGWYAYNSKIPEVNLKQMFRGATGKGAVDTDVTTEIRFDEPIIGCFVSATSKWDPYVQIAAVKTFPLTPNVLSTSAIDFTVDLIDAVHIIPNGVNVPQGESKFKTVFIRYCKDDDTPCQPPSPCLNGGECVAAGTSYTCQCGGIYSGTNCDVCTGRDLDENDIVFQDSSYDNLFTGTYDWTSNRYITMVMDAPGSTPASTKIDSIQFELESVSSVQLRYDGKEMKHWLGLGSPVIIQYNIPSADKVSVIDLVRTGSEGKIKNLVIKATC